MRRIAMWLFETPRRVWTTIVAILVICMALGAVFIGVKVSAVIDTLDTPSAARGVEESELALRNPDAEALERAVPDGAPEPVAPDPAPVAAQAAGAWLAGDIDVLSQVAEPGLLEEEAPDVELAGQPVVTLQAADTARVEIPTSSGLLLVSMIYDGVTWRAYGFEVL